MQTVDEDQDLNGQDQSQDIETIHLYVVREQDKRPSPLPIVLSAVTLVALILLCALSPSRQQVERTLIRAPAVFPPIQVFTASAQIQATGIKTYQATSAHGLVTIFNGSILPEEIPQGMILTTRSGIEVVTDTNVFVPAGNPPNFGIATVQAHAAVAGVQGNIPAWAINQVYGASLYLRNLSAFRGGRDAYSVQVVTQHDIQVATSTARATLTQKIFSSKLLLASPCTESIQQKNFLATLTWACQFYTFSIPARFHITSFQLIGKNVIVEAYYVARPVIIQYK